VPSNEFSGVLKITDEVCEWDDESEECSLASLEMKSLLKESDTDFAGLLLERIVSFPQSDAFAISGIGVCRKERRR